MNFLPSIVSQQNFRNGKSLGPDYVVTDHDVLCGRGKICYFHPGNVRYREIVSFYIPNYQKAITKYQKTCIINEIVTMVRSNSPNGGFIRKDFETNNFFEVGDFLAVSKYIACFLCPYTSPFSLFPSNANLSMRKHHKLSVKPWQLH